MSLVLGITGSFGSGKSAVAGMFAELGVPVIDADELAREVVAPGSEGLAEVVEAFGEEVLDGEGALDRKKVAGIVFDDPEARQRLNEITHPRVGRRMAEFVSVNEAAPAVALEIPLLLEGGRRVLVDKVVVVTTSERARFGRLKEKGFSEAEVMARLGTQMAQARKIELADSIIKNNGDIETTREQVRKIAAECGVEIETDKSQ